LKRLPAAIFAPIVFILAGCTSGQGGNQVGSTPVGEEPGVPVIPIVCKVEDYARFQGQQESVLAATTFPKGLAVRVIRPGQAVTMDFSANRVNFLLDGQGLITQITCG
jgi:hypothetical protein